MVLITASREVCGTSCQSKKVEIEIQEFGICDLAGLILTLSAIIKHVIDALIAARRFYLRPPIDPLPESAQKSKKTSSTREKSVSNGALNEPHPI
jgi:hypothetical protein